jgi:site-specific recombinase XerD
MKWQYWITLYTGTHCSARGLRTLTIAAYQAALAQWREYVRLCLADKPPDRISPRELLEYLEHLRRDRGNGDAALNRTLTIIRGFYRAMVAMGQLDPDDNPLKGFPSIKAVPRKLPTVLTPEETERLLNEPPGNTILGLRDRAVLALLYGSGIRASECASLTQGQVNLTALTITVCGKGGHQRTLPLHPQLAAVLKRYQLARGPALPQAPFFRSRRGRALSRGALYERVRTCARRARLGKLLSPHRLRHTFATHLVRAGVNLVTIRDLLGHRQITSTQIYLHVTAQDLRTAADRHPIGRLLATVEHLLPDVRLPFQYAARARGSG